MTLMVGQRPGGKHLEQNINLVKIKTGDNMKGDVDSCLDKRSNEIYLRLGDSCYKSEIRILEDKGTLANTIL